MMIQPLTGALFISCNCMECVTLHPGAAGAEAMRGAFTMRHGAVASLAASNLLTPFGKKSEETFIALDSGGVQSLNKNSPEAMALATLCFMVLLVKARMGRLECAALKKLWRARFARRSSFFVMKISYSKR